MRSPKVSSHLLRRYLGRLSVLPCSRPGPPPAQKWWREPLVYGLTFGVPLLLLFPYYGLRPDAVFQARIQTSGVEFTMGDYHNAGLFASGDGRVDITFDGLDKVDLGRSEQWKPRHGNGAGGNTTSLMGGSVRFINVKLSGIYAASGTHVGLLWEVAAPTGVAMTIDYGGKPPVAAGQIEMDALSLVRFNGSVTSNAPSAHDGEIRISQEGAGPADVFADASGRLNISITPCPSATTDCAPVTSVGASKPVTQSRTNVAPIPPEDHLALLPGSGITFLDARGESAILGDESAVELANADRKEAVLRGQVLKIGSLKERPATFPSKSRYPSKISLELNPRGAKDMKEGIAVNVLAQAGELRIDGDDKRPSAAEWLVKNKILSVWLATVILLGNALLTILTRANLLSWMKKGG